MPPRRFTCDQRRRPIPGFGRRLRRGVVADRSRPILTVPFLKRSVTPRAVSRPTLRERPSRSMREARQPHRPERPTVDADGRSSLGPIPMRKSLRGKARGRRRISPRRSSASRRKLAYRRERGRRHHDCAVDEEEHARHDARYPRPWFMGCGAVP